MYKLCGGKTSFSTKRVLLYQKRQIETSSRFAINSRMTVYVTILYTLYIMMFVTTVCVFESYVLRYDKFVYFHVFINRCSHCPVI